MLYYDRIEVSGGIDINNTSKSKQCGIYHYWYFLDKRFKFQLYACNVCHDVLMMSMNLTTITGDITSLKIHGADYRCIITRTSKK